MALPAPNSPVALCRLALSQLKQDDNVVNNIDTPTSDLEALLKQHYPQVRRATLRSGVWNFAIKRVQLAANATAPLFGFTNAFDLPADFIRYLSRHDDSGIPIQGAFLEGADYEIENGQFLTSNTVTTSTVLNMRYIFDQEDLLKWDPLTVDLFTLNLALRLAPEFKSAPRTIQNIKDQLRELKAEAKAIDGQERPPKRIQRSKFLQARRGRSANVAGKFTRFD